MPPPSKPSNQVRFSEYAVDLHTAELRYNDHKVTLQDQPFQVLAVLLEHAGQLVTRDELKKRLWPSDTFGDFDHGLNKAVNRLREVLSDSAENPRFIETLPRKGYRFIAPVEKVTDNGASSQAAAAPLSNLSGKKVSHYRVLDLLGGGGMGVVYKAEDTKLGRRVALKFLPEELSSDLVALERFEREARAASALNHPNICTIYSIEEHEGQSFLVMELLEGETLRELISGAQMMEGSMSNWKGPVCLDKLLDTAIQVTNGLAAAHEKGIIHRDIKPANVFLTRQGQVKILDFGLAKLLGSEAPERPPSGDKQKQALNPNLTLTHTGETIGTVGYMSPEQVRGEHLDFRTDLFSFGMVLYEMTTGQKACGGDTAPVLRDAILNGTPTPVRELNPEVPIRLESIINRALEKDRDARYQNASDISDDLENLAHEILPRRRYRFIGPVNDTRASAGGAKRRMIGPGSLRMTAMVAAFVAAVAVVVVAVWHRSPISSPQIVGSRQLTNDGVLKVGGMVTDGARIYFGEAPAGRNVLMQVSTAGGEAAVIKTSAPDPVIQAISPDQSELLVTAGGDYWRPEGGHLWLVDVPAGIGRRMGELVGRAGGWERTPKGKFYFNTGKDIYVSDYDGNHPRKVATAPGIVDDIACSPDGSKLRFTVFDLGKDTFSIWEVRSDGDAMHPLLPGWNDPHRDCCGRWTPDGRYYVFQTEQGSSFNIWALRERNALFGRYSNRPIQITSGPLSFSIPVSSKDGKQLFVIGSNARVEIVGYDKSSSKFVPFLGGISVFEPSFSRDGKWMTYVDMSGLWRSKSDGSEAVQLTFPPMRPAWPQWSPDGQRIAFSAFAPGKAYKVWLVSRDGGTPQQLTESDEEVADERPTWSPDGNTLAFGTYAVGRRDQSSIKLLDLKTRKSSKLPGSEGIFFPRWSPDGRYLVGIPSEATQLMLFDFRVQKWRRLIGRAGTIGYASWSSDSAYVYFDDLFTEDPAYFRVRVADSKLDRIASLKGVRRYSSLNEPPWSGLAPGEIPLFVRDLTTQEIYALDWQLP